MKNRIISLLFSTALLIAAAVLSFPTYATSPFTDKVRTLSIHGAPYSDDTILLTPTDPIPGQLWNYPAIKVPGYEMDPGSMMSDPFSGRYDLEMNGSDSIATYENGSVAILHIDGTYEGIAYDGTRVYSNPCNGKYQREENDGTKIEYEAGGALKVTRPDGDKIVVAADGKTTIERDNGLISEHDSNGKITSIGIAGSNERIDMTRTGSGEYTGGMISCGDGSCLEVASDGSFTYTDSDNNTYILRNDDGKMSGEKHTPDVLELKADDNGITFSPDGESEYTYEFDENGVATIPMSNGGSVNYNRDDDGFSLITGDDEFNLIIDENGNLVEADDEDLHFILRVNPDGSIISGKFRKDENGELVEINEDGSAKYEKDGGKLVVDVEGGLDAEGFDWFSDFDEDLSAKQNKDSNVVSGDANSLDTSDGNYNIEPLNINLKLFSAYGFSLDDVNEPSDTPLDVSLSVDKDGNVVITMPSFSYKHYWTYLGDDGYYPYDLEEYDPITIKGKLTSSYRSRKDGAIRYIQSGIITEKTHFSGKSEEYHYDINNDCYYYGGKEYDLDCYPYGYDNCTPCFSITYFTDTNHYQVYIELDGMETQKKYRKDEAPETITQPGFMYIHLFNGTSVSDFDYDFYNDGEVDQRIEYDTSGG